MLEVHRKNISIHGLLLILSLKTNSNDFCVCHNVRSHFCLVRTFPIKEPVQHESESLRQWILSIFMPSESQNCYTGSSLILPRLIITSLILLSLGLIRGHGLPHCVQSKVKAKLGYINIMLILIPKGLGFHWERLKIEYTSTILKNTILILV